MENDFKDVMSKRTDEQLIKIVTVERSDYQSLAIDAAEEEIRKRNIDVTKIEQVKADLTIQIEEQKQFDSKKVSSTLRFANFIIDTFAFLILAVILSFLVSAFVNPTDPTLTNLLGYTILAISFFGYYIYMETKYQKTIGKFITKTTLVTKVGEKPEVGDIVRRTFFRLIPFDRVSFLFTQNGFHDKLSDTTVIRDQQ
jgi:uncharacterized RDD family membrane protein YckC